MFSTVFISCSQGVRDFESEGVTFNSERLGASFIFKNFKACAGPQKPGKLTFLKIKYVKYSSKIEIKNRTCVNYAILKCTFCSLLVSLIRNFLSNFFHLLTFCWLA